MIDPFRGTRPLYLIKIAEEVVVAQSYNLSANNRGDSQSANITIPLENITSEVFNNTDVMSNIFEVEIWAGYTEDTKDYNEQRKEFIELIKHGKTPQLLSKRFDGFVAQPNWQIGTRGKYLQLSCLDWTALLKEYKYFNNIEDGATEIRNIISLVNKDVTGLEIELTPYNGSVRVGEYDQEDKKHTYNSSGKTYWDILDDCAKKLGYIIYTEGKKIILAPNKKSPFIWPMYMGSRENVMKTFEGQQIAKGQLFDNLDIRFGQKGKVEKSEVIIECLGTNHKKRGTNRAIRVIYPEDKKITFTTRFEKIVVPGDCTEAKLKIVAENRYKELSRLIMTGTLTLDFANPFINIHDIIEFVGDEPELRTFLGYWFNVCGISEDGNDQGFTQSIEFESDENLKNRVQRKIPVVTDIYGVDFQKR